MQERFCQQCTAAAVIKGMTIGTVFPALYHRRIPRHIITDLKKVPIEIFGKESKSKTRSLMLTKHDADRVFHYKHTQKTIYSAHSVCFLEKILCA